MSTPGHLGSTPVPPLLPPSEPGNGGGGGSGRLLKVVVGLLFLVLVLLMLIVVWLLPGLVGKQDESGDGQRGAKKAGAMPSRPRAISENMPVSPVPEFDQSSGKDNKTDRSAQEADEERAAASESRKRWYEQKARAELANMQVWGGEDFRSATKEAGRASSLFEAGRFREADQLFRHAITLIRNLESGKSELLENSVDAGTAALEEGNCTGAERLFRIALAVDPDDGRALAGSKRLQVCQKVFSLLSGARRAVSENRLREARNALERASKLDPLNKAVSNLLRDVSERLKRDLFQQHVGKVIISLAAGRPEDAAAELARARKLYPRDPSLSELSSRVETALRSSRLSRFLAKASEAEETEEWDRALMLYKKAAALDPASLRAANGVSKATETLHLVQGLEKIVGEPDRLRDDGPLDDARRIVAIAKQSNQFKGPKGRALVQRAEQVIQRAQTPVPVRFSSDNQTEVTIYHAGRLGRFTSRRLRLRPGRYTVAGSRPGYRDVRMVIRVSPENADQVYDIRCTEKVR